VGRSDEATEGNASRGAGFQPALGRCRCGAVTAVHHDHSAREVALSAVRLCGFLSVLPMLLWHGYASGAYSIRPMGTGDRCPTAVRPPRCAPQPHLCPSLARSSLRGSASLYKRLDQTRKAPEIGRKSWFSPLIHRGGAAPRPSALGPDPCALPHHHKNRTKSLTCGVRTVCCRHGC
jgi:hypothetical protein